MCLPCTFWRTESNSRHTYDVTIWLSRTTDNSNIFIRSREVRDNESRLYLKLMCEFAIVRGRRGGGEWRRLRCFFTMAAGTVEEEKLNDFTLS